MRGQLKAEWSDEQRVAQREQIDAFRLEREAARAEATRALAGFGYVRGDLHTHSVYSDGSGAVADLVRVARLRGLDFLFVTDHTTVRQRIECRKYPAVWWGQEPGAGPHHVCILVGRRRFVPSCDIRRDAERLRALGHFFFYPHPVGWYPNVRYTDAQKDALGEAGREFAIEVMNGIFRTDPFHDEWTEGNVALWDRYLCAGCRVTGLGATDSHFAPGVGNVWTGCADSRPTLQSVLAALRAGRVFASSGPAINLTCGRASMGSALKAKRGTVSVHVQCADSYGLAWARLVQDGRAVRELPCRGQRAQSEDVRVRLRAADGYVRAECASLDDRRAYSNPIYFRR